MKRINLALQGGGSHGAYTWGVLDRLLEEESIEFEGISGTSAGAMNAAILAHGLEKSGRKGAKEELENFWYEISELGKYSPFLQQTPFDKMSYGWNLDGMPGYNYFDTLTRIFSPYQFNPYNINLLKNLLETTIDFNLIRNSKKIKLYISATKIKTGQARVFKTSEMNVNVLLASACLPFIAQAIEINGDHYWDGGYMGNPSIWPLIYGCESRDVLLIQINPLIRHKLPVHSHEIINRINEISFNASLIAEMRAIHFVSKLLDAEKLDKNVYKDLHMHMIESSESIQNLNASSKMNTDINFLLYLKKLGRDATELWLGKNLGHLGITSSLNIEKVFFPAMIVEHPYLDENNISSPLVEEGKLKKSLDLNDNQ